jgi:transcriptional regulator with XRE-family HTH domain
MDIMDTARLNIKRRRELKGLRQQDMADKLNMNIRSYQHLENGSTRLDLERLEQISGILETPMEDFLRQEGHYIQQEFKDGGNNGSGLGFGNENTYHNNVTDKEIVEKLISAKDGEINMLKENMKSLRDDNKYLKEENQYLRNKIDQFMEMVGKKG